MTDEVKNEPLEALRKRWEFEKSPTLSLQLAEDYGRRGDFLDAITVLRSGLEGHPNHVASRVLLARNLIELEQWREARELLEGVASADPTHLVANKLLVKTYLALGEMAEARNRLDLYALFNESDPDIEDLERRLAEPPSAAPAAVAADGEEVADTEGLREAADAADAAAAPDQGPSDGGEEAAEPEVPAVAATLPVFPLPPPADREAGGAEPRAEADRSPATRGAGRSVSLEPPEPASGEPFGDVWSRRGRDRAGASPDPGDIFQLTPRLVPPRAEELTEVDLAGLEKPTSLEEPAPSTVSLGQLYLEQGHREEAVRTFSEVLEREPDRVAARVGLAAARGDGDWSLNALQLVSSELLEGGDGAARRKAVLEGYLGRLRAATAAESRRTSGE